VVESSPSQEGLGDLINVHYLMAAPCRACIRSAHVSIPNSHPSGREKKSPSIRMRIDH
jgi:hypothetical protein